MSEFQEAYSRLNAEQKLAVDSIDGPVLVIAGPGTGKTQLLSVRIANILKRTDSLPQNILALTFTDSAAHTMRQRLTNLIGQQAYDVSISTYHAFGSELIRRFPEYFLSEQPERPVDDLTIDQILREIIASLPYTNPLRFSGNYLRDIKSLISDFKHALLSPEDIKKLSSENEQFIRTASVMTKQFLSGVRRIDKNSVRLFQKLAVSTSNLVPKPTKSHIQPLVYGWQQSLEEALSEVDTSGKTNALTAWKNKWLTKDGSDDFVADGLRTSQKLAAAALVYEHYLQRLRELNLYDYDDMILRAIRGLEDNDDLRFSLQEQYLYILLDEFQDTNQAQLRLVELLTNNPTSEGRPNVLAVGDDDQAIYAFQGADYSHMLDFSKLYRDVLIVSLTKNYRSHNDVLHLARNVAGQIEIRLTHNFPHIDKYLSAENDKLPRHAEVGRFEFKSDLAQFAWIVKKVAKLIRTGISPSEIAILAPEHRYLEPLVPYMQHSQIPLRYERRENVLDDPIVVQLITMSRLVLALSDNNESIADSLWPEVLSYECWQIATTEIWDLSWLAREKNQPWTKTIMSVKRLRPIALFFLRLSLMSHTETLEIMLDYIIGSEPTPLLEADMHLYSSPFYGHYFASTDTGHAAFWDLLSNLTVLRQHLREYKPEQVTGLLLRDLINFVEAHQLADIKILNTSPYAEAVDAVQLMTAFKAKGAEFTAVFVLAVQDEVWGATARTGSSHISLPPNLEFIRYGGASLDERLRLFFVAITRAKTHLYLTNYTSNYVGRATSRLRFLNEIELDGKIVSQQLPPNQQIVQQIDTTPPQLHELSVYWQQRHLSGNENVDMRAKLETRLQKYQLSPTHLNKFIDIEHGGPHEFFIQTLLRFPRAPNANSQFGNAVHETLEWLAHACKQKTPTGQQLIKVFEKNLKAKRLSQQDTDLLIERGARVLMAYHQQRAKLLGKNDIAEYDFRREGVFAGSAHMGGKIDRLIVNRAAKTVTVVDYKTGKSHRRWSADTQLHKYRQQLYLYKYLVERSHTFAGYTVTDAFLEFVEPDEEGLIRELHLRFDDKELRTLLNLVEVVWEHITTLNFPDVEAYRSSLAGIKQFEADLLAAKI